MDWREQVRVTLPDFEWLIFGTWDTPRCPSCKGWKKADSYGKHHQGHLPNCKLNALLRLAYEPEQLELFGG